MEKIKKLMFPSINIPGADLRVFFEFGGTKYDFTCEECNNKVTIYLEKFMSTDCYNWKDEFSEEIINEINNKFNNYNTYGHTKCDSCNSEYIFQINYYETSNCAFRVEILGVGIII